MCVGEQQYLQDDDFCAKLIRNTNPNGRSYWVLV